MTKWEDVIPDGPDWLARKARSIADDIQELQSARSGEAMSIGRGGLTVHDNGAIKVQLANGVQIFYSGPLIFGGVSYQGTIMRRADGSALFYTFPVNGNPNMIAWRWLDHLGNEVLASDAATGGLARPWMPIHLVSKIAMATGVFSYYNTPVAGVTAETQLWEGRIPLVSHPFIELDGLWGQASGSNSTTYRLKVAGFEVGNWTVAGGLSSTRRGPYNISAYLGMSWVAVELTAIASGTGNTACHIRAAAMRQT